LSRYYTFTLKSDRTF